jgi:hypothetical protein
VVVSVISLSRIVQKILTVICKYQFGDRSVKHILRYYFFLIVNGIFLLLLAIKPTYLLDSMYVTVSKTKFFVVSLLGY